MWDQVTVEEWGSKRKGSLDWGWSRGRGRPPQEAVRTAVSTSIRGLDLPSLQQSGVCMTNTPPLAYSKKHLPFSRSVAFSIFIKFAFSSYTQYTFNIIMYISMLCSLYFNNRYSVTNTKFSPLLLLHIKRMHYYNHSHCVNSYCSNTSKVCDHFYIFGNILCNYFMLPIYEMSSLKWKISDATIKARIEVRPYSASCFYLGLFWWWHPASYRMYTLSVDVRVLRVEARNRD